MYPDPDALQRVLGQLARLPPLVTSWEIENLKHQLAEATRGERFLLQGGDCSESFEDCESAAIASKLKILLADEPGAGAGRQEARHPHRPFCRPIRQTPLGRHRDARRRHPAQLPRRHDQPRRVHPEDRTPNPDLLLRAYERSGLTINFIRSLIEGGFADLHHPEYWELGFVANSPHAAEYTRMVETIGESLRFMETLTGSVLADINRVDFFTSHEGLHLYYEQAQTRQVPRRTGWYNLSTHFPWIGDRTRALDGAHIEYFRGIANPIGVKIGPTVTPDEAVALAEVLNPQNEPGRPHVHSPVRGGAAWRSACHRWSRRSAASGRQVLWCCDPMHGNTETTKSGIKTRRFEKILGELELSCRILKACGAHLGGVHFELTGDNVTECIGGASGVTEADLSRDYRTTLDPRLNYEQAMEMALLLARLLAQNRK